MDFGASQALHLVMAALVGGTVVAASAYYMHKRTLDQLLKYRRRIDGEETEEEGQSEPARGKRRRRQNGRKLGRDAARYSRFSSSIPAFATVEGGGLDYYHGNGDDHKNGDDVNRHKKWNNYSINEVEKRSRSSYGNLTMIPSGLPRLETRRDGSRQSLNHLNSTKRVPVSTPKSPNIINGGAFESMEIYDEEDETHENNGGEGCNEQIQAHSTSTM